MVLTFRHAQLIKDTQTQSQMTTEEKSRDAAVTSSLLWYCGLLLLRVGREQAHNSYCTVFEGLQEMIKLSYYHCLQMSRHTFSTCSG